jgi:hypothetical protein
MTGEISITQFSANGVVAKTPLPCIDEGATTNEGRIMISI